MRLLKLYYNIFHINYNMILLLFDRLTGQIVPTPIQCILEHTEHTVCTVRFMQVEFKTTTHCAVLD